MANIQDIWKALRPEPFCPHPNQERAILHSRGPLYLPAGPGAGKTRVLLWRTVNLIAFQGVKPENIFLATFTEKAALQLREGLRSLLEMATEVTNIPYDASRVYVGTAHSLCQRILRDHRFSKGAEHRFSPVLLDELSQYLYLTSPGSLELRKPDPAQQVGVTRIGVYPVPENVHAKPDHACRMLRISFFEQPERLVFVAETRINPGN
jgi:superfamily I DNA/RNA helicase